MNSTFELAASLPQGHFQVLPTLHDVLCDCGGWIISRGCVEPGLVRVIFEFPRDICVDIYSTLVSLGLELSSHSHRLLAELCRCTPHLFELPSGAVTAVDAISLDQSTRYICSLEIIKVELYVRFVAGTALPERDSDAA